MRKYVEITTNFGRVRIQYISIFNNIIQQANERAPLNGYNLENLWHLINFSSTRMTTKEKEKKSCQDEK